MEHEQNSQRPVNRKIFIILLIIIKDIFRIFFDSSFLSDIISPIFYRLTVAEKSYLNIILSIFYRLTIAEKFYLNIILSKFYRPTVAEEFYLINRINNLIISYNTEVNESIIIDITL